MHQNVATGAKNSDLCRAKTHEEGLTWKQLFYKTIDINFTEERNLVMVFFDLEKELRMRPVNR